MLRESFPASRRLLLDANLLVILVIGRVRKQLFGTSPVEQYRDSDYDLLVGIIGEFAEIVTTPYLLSEVNMLLTKTGEFYCEECRAALSVLIPEFICHFTEPSSLAEHPHFASFGISDISIVDCSVSETFVLTAEGSLTGFLRGNNIPVLQYTELKSTFGIA